MELPVRTFSDVSRFLKSGGNAEDFANQTLDAIEARNGDLHAFVALDRPGAIAAARAIDARRDKGEALGPLAGATIAIKDNIDVLGIPTRAGSLTRANAAPASRDAPVVARLRAAGAIIVGKTHSTEYTFGGWGTNETIGTPLNPRDLGHPRVPGGSSSGSGVAVAAGLCVAALGSDTGGSIRLPASFCGIVGLKTTAGLIECEGVIPLVPALDTVGPMTNCVADAAALLQVLAPQAPRDWRGKLDKIAQGEALPVKGLRIGIVKNLDVDMHTETARALIATRELLERLGVGQAEISLPKTPRDLAAPCGELLALEAYRLYGDLAEEEPCRLGAPVRARILAGKTLPASRLQAIDEDRQQSQREISGIFERFDLLLLPTTPYPALLLSEYDENASPGLLTRFVNYLDLAALSLPVSATANGLPLCMQFVAPRLSEPAALTIGAALERERGPIAGL
jgi:aspartyl-tRNA(Asn)/glutamyl-tRNA(Gln) amidotransferase subunit A